MSDLPNLELKAAIKQYERGKKLMENENTCKEAIPYFKQALEIFEREPLGSDMLEVTFSNLSRCSYWIGSYVESIRYANKAISLNSTSVIPWLKKCQSLKELGKYEEALVNVNKALIPNNLYAGHSYLLHVKGNILFELTNYEQAIDCFQKALEKDPNNKIIQKDLDSVKAKLSKDSSSKTAEKMEIIKKSEHLDVNSLYKEAKSFFDADYFEQAIGCYDQIIKINPNESFAWQLKGYILDRQRKYDEAISCFDKALEIDPDDHVSRESKHEVEKLVEDLKKIQEPPVSSSDNDPLKILKVRLAKGEITIDEFNEIKEHLA